MFLFRRAKKTTEDATIDVPRRKDSKVSIIDESSMTGIRWSKADLNDIVGVYMQYAKEEIVPDDHDLFTDRFSYGDYVIIFRCVPAIPTGRGSAVSVLCIILKYFDVTKWDKKQRLSYAKGCIAKSPGDVTSHRNNDVHK